MPKWMKWNKSGFRFGLKFVYIVHILGRHKDHYSFKDKNDKMDEMKLKSGFRFGLKFVYIVHILGRHKDHYSFKDKNAKMDEMK
jgi:hypothetical protein